MRKIQSCICKESSLKTWRGASYAQIGGRKQHRQGKIKFKPRRKNTTENGENGLLIRENGGAERGRRITHSDLGGVDRFHTSMGSIKQGQTPGLCLWSLPSRPISFPGGWAIVFVFWFLLFLFAAWFYPWLPCLSALQENTWSPMPLHPVIYRREVSLEEPLTHFKVLPF